MIQCGSSLGLALKTGDRLRVMGHVLGEELERDQAVELQVLSFVHDAHAAAAQLLEDPVVRNAVADHWGKILGLEVAQVNEGANVGCIPTRQVTLNPNTQSEPPTGAIACRQVGADGIGLCAVCYYLPPMIEVKETDDGKWGLHLDGVLLGDSKHRHDADHAKQLILRYLEKRGGEIKGDIEPN